MRGYRIYGASTQEQLYIYFTFISGSEGGWHHIAWAFLKPVAANGALNTEKQVRLQLYKPQRMRKSRCNSCDVS
jgi:hypothetical protein